MTETGNGDIILQAHALRKTYGHVVALDDADFELRRGEIMGVIGDNGAGKSTLIKMFAGAAQPDSGEIVMNGTPVSLRSPTAARAHGIETVYQDLAMAPSMKVWANMFLGREQTRWGSFGKLLGILDKPGMRTATREHMKDFGFKLPSVDVRIGDLSGGQRQGIAVARGSVWGRNVVILDEPTAALGVRESGMVEKMIEDVRDRGASVILISHNMPQVFRLCDRIHIQRLGRRAALVSTTEISMPEAVAVLTGALPGWPVDPQAAEQAVAEAHPAD